jgi:hypothetical protein
MVTAAMPAAAAEAEAAAQATAAEAEAAGQAAAGTGVPQFEPASWPKQSTSYLVQAAGQHNLARCLGKFQAQCLSGLSYITAQVGFLPEQSLFLLCASIDEPYAATATHQSLFVVGQVLTSYAVLWEPSAHAAVPNVTAACQT